MGNTVDWNKVRKNLGISKSRFRIALIGKRRAGKDYLCSKLPFEFKVLSFSDRLKEIAKYIYPWMEFDYSPDKKEQIIAHRIENGKIVQFTPRQIWNMLDMLRLVDDYVFIRDVVRQIDENVDCNIIIKDVRKIDEFNMLRLKKFKFVYVESNFSPKDLDEHDTLVDKLLAHQADFHYKNLVGDENLSELVDFIEKSM